MPTPEQKRQAAAIFTAASEGKVIERCIGIDEWKEVDPFHEAVRYFVHQHPSLFRIAPDPIAPGHNPAGVKVSQVGEGWRLLNEAEIINTRKSAKAEIQSWGGYDENDPRWEGEPRFGNSETITYRTRLSVEALAALDKPEEKKLPEDWSRELNITVRDPDGWDRKNFETDWMIPLTRAEFNAKASRSTCQRGHYVPSRFAKPAWRLPDPPAGKRWHREGDWKEEYLPFGYRPFLQGEKVQQGDERYDIADGNWTTWQKEWGSTPINADYQALFRTTRPLPVFNPRDLPGFRPLLPTEQNHRDDFTEADLPEGWRPLLKGEPQRRGDEWELNGVWNTVVSKDYGDISREHCCKRRSRRPLPSVPRTRPWSKPEDVPVNFWVRHISADGVMYAPVNIHQSGIQIYWERDTHRIPWATLAEFYEYSLDRKTWQKCEVVE